MEAQTVDKEYVKAQNIKASELDREGKFEAANKVLDDLLALLEDQKADPKYFTTTKRLLALTGVAVVAKPLLTLIPNLTSFVSSMVSNKGTISSVASASSHPHNLQSAYNSITLIAD